MNREWGMGNRIIYPLFPTPYSLNYNDLVVVIQKNGSPFSSMRSSALSFCVLKILLSRDKYVIFSAETVTFAVSGSTPYRAMALRS